MLSSESRDISVDKYSPLYELLFSVCMNYCTIFHLFELLFSVCMNYCTIFRLFELLFFRLYELLFSFCMNYYFLSVYKLPVLF